MKPRKLTKAEAKRFIYGGIATSFDLKSGWDPTEFLGLDQRSEADGALMKAAHQEVIAELKAKAGNHR